MKHKHAAIYLGVFGTLLIAAHQSAPVVFKSDSVDVQSAKDKVLRQADENIILNILGLMNETPDFQDFDGALVSANVVVFKSNESQEKIADGAISTTHREGWYAVKRSSLTAASPHVLDAILSSCYVASAYIDRFGGLAWPTEAGFIVFKSDASESDRQRALKNISDSVLKVENYQAIPGLIRVSFKVATGDKVMSILQNIALDPAVQFTEPDMAFTGKNGGVPTDPGFVNCWGHLNTGSGGGVTNFDMHSTNAWNFTTGDPSIAVLVIDVGVEQSHPDIQQTEGRDFTGGDISGIAGGDPINTCDSHGTAVAGCISARMNNGVGTVGSAPNCVSVSARCFISATPCTGSWTANYSWTANALNWAALNGIRISNNSNWYGSGSSSLSYAYSVAREGGMVHFACAGNDANTNIWYPANLISVNAIGAMARNQTRSTFSCYGEKLFLMAPGTSIYTTDRTGNLGYSTSSYATVSGTSFASPYSAGVAALMLSKNPTLSPDDIEAILAFTAQDLGDLGKDSNYGWGMINSYEAVRSAAMACTCFADLDRSGVVDFGDVGLVLLDFNCVSCPVSDLDGSGIVDSGDVGLVLLSM